MSEEDFLYKISLLENLHEYIALIDTKRIEFLSKDGTWKKIDIPELEYIPVTLYVNVSTTKNIDNLIYIINYNLLSPQIHLIPSHTEKIVFSIDESLDKPYNVRYQSRENELFENATLRYDNKGINIFSRIKSNDVVSNYIESNSKLLHQAVQMINDKKNPYVIKPAK